MFNTETTHAYYTYAAEGRTGAARVVLLCLGLEGLLVETCTSCFRAWTPRNSGGRATAFFASELNHTGTPPTSQPLGVEDCPGRGLAKKLHQWLLFFFGDRGFLGVATAFCAFARRFSCALNFDSWYLVNRPGRRLRFVRGFSVDADQILGT